MCIRYSVKLHSTNANLNLDAMDKGFMFCAHDIENNELCHTFTAFWLNCRSAP